MRHSFWEVRFIQSIIVAAGAVLLVFSTCWAAEDTSKTWSTEQLLGVLIRQQSLPLDMSRDQAGCRSALSGRKRATLGDYLAFLTASLDPTYGHSGVTSTCEPAKQKDKTSCTVMFNTGVGAEDPWRYGVKFEINDAGQIDPKSLTCPGAG